MSRSRTSGAIGPAWPCMPRRRPESHLADTTWLITRPFVAVDLIQQPLRTGFHQLRGVDRSVLRRCRYGCWDCSIAMANPAKGAGRRVAVGGIGPMVRQLHSVALTVLQSGLRGCRGNAQGGSRSCSGSGRSSGLDPEGALQRKGVLWLPALTIAVLLP